MCRKVDWYRYKIFLRDWVYHLGSWEVAKDWYVATPPVQCKPSKDKHKVTEQQVRAAVIEFGLRAGEITMNPPDGATLVQFPSIFSTDQGAYPFTLTVAGVDIDLTATPVAYHWTFGDAGERTWDTPGRPYEEGVPMSKYHTFTFTDTGTYPVELTIDYEVTWKPAGTTEWRTIDQPIPSRPGEPLKVKVLENRNVLSGSGR